MINLEVDSGPLQRAMCQKSKIYQLQLSPLFSEVRSSQLNTELANHIVSLPQESGLYLLSAEITGGHSTYLASFYTGSSEQNFSYNYTTSGSLTALFP